MKRVIFVIFRDFIGLLNAVCLFFSFLYIYITFRYISVFLNLAKKYFVFISHLVWFSMIWLVSHLLGQIVTLWKSTIMDRQR